MLRESNSNFDIISDAALAVTGRRHGKMGSYETPFREFTEWFSPLPSYFL
jgi:hypothetical protein